MNNLETERLVLRNWQDGDAEELFLAAKNPNVGPMCGWDPHKDVSESLFSIRNILNSENCFALVLKETGKPVGSIELMTGEKSRLSASDSEAELGYWLGRPHWGQGLTTEAARLLLARCFGELGMKAVWGVHYEGNAASRRVMEKCGFTFHHSERAKGMPPGGVLTEHFMRLTAEAWAARTGRGL